MVVAYLVFPVPVALTAAIMSLLFAGATPAVAALVYVGTGMALTLGLAAVLAVRRTSGSCG